MANKLRLYLSLHNFEKIKGSIKSMYYYLTITIYFIDKVSPLGIGFVIKNNSFKQ